MENEQMTFIDTSGRSAGKEQQEGYSPKEQELIHQLVQERLGKKSAIEFE